MSDGCSVACDCDEGECAVGRAFALGVTMGVMLSDEEDTG
jgi:hypothetical protein